MRSLNLTALAVCLILPSIAPSPVAAQQEEQPKPAKFENVAWYEIAQVDFKSGKTDKAMEIIENYYEKASVAAGTPGPEMLLRHHTGEWDLTVIWLMKDGPADMEWDRSPEGIAWYEKFVELAGGEEKAEEIGERFQSYIARENVTIARRSMEAVDTAMR